jgi:signal transduction histidine kinase
MFRKTPKTFFLRFDPSVTPEKYVSGDSGKGIDPEIVAEGRAGHYGVPGMRERAKRIGGKLDVWTGTGAGTEIELSIPGSIAYGTSLGRSVLGLFRKKAANG